MNTRISRRTFIKETSELALVTGMALKPSRAENAPQSRVIEVYNPGAVSGRQVNKPVVSSMLKQGMESLTGSSVPWSKFIDKNDRVGLKINTLGRPVLYTHHELIQVVIEELRAIGVKDDNIIVWDRHEAQMEACNFVLNLKGGVRTFGTERSSLHEDYFDPKVAYTSEFDEPERRKDGRVDSWMSTIFTQMCDKVINMAIIKDHGISGVTLCLKNLAYGLTENNSRFHGREYIGTFISEYCAMPIVREKVVLHMIDGLEGCYDQGPKPGNASVLFSPMKLWLGTDPVALDTVGYQVINQERKDRGIEPLEATGRPLDHIELAGKKGAGVSDMNRIQIIRLNNKDYRG